jgi:hypothetical protein
MAGLVPAIHVFILGAHKVVDARDKRGHDEWRVLGVGCWVLGVGDGDRSMRWRVAHVIERAQSLPDQRYAVKVYFPIGDWG